MLAMPRDLFDWHAIGGKKKGKLLLASNREQTDTVLTVSRWMHHITIMIKESIPGSNCSMPKRNVICRRGSQ